MDLVFQALGQDFEVIHIKEMWQGYQILQCRRLNGTTQYTILHFEREQYVKELLPVFFSLKENQAYEDYKGCFTKNGDLYVVFIKKDGTSLAKLLQEGTLSIEQRLLIGKRILEKMLLWNLSDFMICQLLNVNRILIDGEQIAFDYEWILDYEECSDMSFVNKKAAELIGKLFQKEKEDSMSPTLLKVLEDLEQNQPKDFFAIYETYNNLCRTLLEETAAYVSGIQKLKQKIEDGVKKFSGIGKVILVFVMYIIAIFLFVNGTQNQQEEETEPSGVEFEKIGTLRIE